MIDRASRARALHAWIVLSLSAATAIAAICLWPFFGNPAAYVALAIAAIAGLACLDYRALVKILREKWVWAFWSAFTLIALAFLLQQGQPSLASIGDFAIFAVAPLVGLALRPVSRKLDASSVSWLFLLAAASGFLVGMVGVFGGQDRISAPELSPIHFADLALIVGFMALAGTLEMKNRFALLLFLGPVFGLVAAIASGTRGALLVALALACVYALAWSRKSSWPAGLKIGAVLGLVGLVLAGFVVAHLAGMTRPLSALEPVLAVLRGELPADNSALYRVEMYLAGLKAFLDAPLVGHGWHNQLAASLPYMSAAGQEGYAAEQWSYIHSDALSLAVSAGLLGFVAYLLAMLAPLLAVGDRPDEQNHGKMFLALTCSVGLVVSGLTDVLFMVEVPKVFLVASAALIAGIKPWHGPSPK